MRPGTLDEIAPTKKTALLFTMVFVLLALLTTYTSISYEGGNDRNRSDRLRVHDHPGMAEPQTVCEHDGGDTCQIAQSTGFEAGRFLH